MTKIFRWIMTAAGIAATGALAAESVEYYDPVGKTNATCSVYCAYAGQTTLTSGWYVVSGVITNGTRITVNGDANLILRDSSELAAMRGVTVDVKSSITNSLTIWAQSTNSVAGKLTATGKDGVSGIGGGDEGAGGNVTINGGEVTAKGGRFAAGIGGGEEGAGGNVTINGGEVTATGGVLAAGIGGGFEGMGGNVTINGGEVTATGGQFGAGIGGGSGSSTDGELDISDLIVGYADGNGNVTSWAATLEEQRVYCRNREGKTVRLEVCEHKDDDGDGVCDVCGKLCGPIRYYDPVGKTNATCSVYVAYANQTTLTSGWYVVSGVITNGTRIFVDGDANLILRDNSELAAMSGVNVDVNNSITNSLTIWAQSTNSVAGKISATGDGVYAGIGGGENRAGGTVTINGGKVSAEGVINGAGIGGGNGGAGGTVTINCGTVSAAGGGYGAGIGGGNVGIGGTVTVNGGTVEAVGAFCGAGIGGGYGGIGGTVTINGGEVTVRGYAGAGIGGGYQCGSHGGLQIYDRAKVAAGKNEANAALVAPTERVDACRMPYAKIEPCKDHHYEYGYCESCGDTLPASVANVVARQRWPWNGLVDIEYDVSGDTVGLKAEIVFEEQDGEGRSWPATKFLAGFEPSAERGHHRATWNATAEGATNIVARVKAVVRLVEGLKK